MAFISLPSPFLETGPDDSVEPLVVSRASPTIVILHDFRTRQWLKYNGGDEVISILDHEYNMHSPLSVTLTPSEGFRVPDASPNRVTDMG